MTSSSTRSTHTRLPLLVFSPVCKCARHTKQPTLRLVTSAHLTLCYRTVLEVIPGFTKNNNNITEIASIHLAPVERKKTDGPPNDWLTGHPLSLS